MISSRSVTDDVSLSVIKSKLAYNSMIFVDNKLTLIYLLIWQQLATVSVHYTRVIFLTWRVLHLWGQTSKANGAYDTINHFALTLPNVHRFKKNSVFQQIKWYICNEVTHRNLNVWLYYFVIYHNSQYIFKTAANCRTFICYKVV